MSLVFLIACEQQPGSDDPSGPSTVRLIGCPLQPAPAGARTTPSPNPANSHVSRPDYLETMISRRSWLSMGKMLLVMISATDAQFLFSSQKYWREPNSRLARPRGGGKHHGMKDESEHRIAWLARNLLPLEGALRRWLQRRARLERFSLTSDDLIQEVYAKFMTIESVDHIRNPRAYIFRTAHSLLMQEIRRHKIVPIEAVDSIDELQFEANEITPDRQLEGRQELGRVAQAIAEMPKRCREVLLLRKVHGLSQREIAERLKIAESTVEKHIARGVRRLMDIHRDGGFEGHAASSESEAETETDGRAIRKQRY